MKTMKQMVTVFSVLLILAGGIFFLQGINVITARSFMRGDIHWSIYGGIMVIVGVILVVTANWKQIRKKP